MASHEFRTPLSAVLSSASLISKYTKEDDQEKRNKHIDRIKDSVKHLNDILEDFLSLGKLDEGRISTDPFEFNLREMITETLSEVKVVLKPGQKFNFKYEGEEMINADKKLLRNILTNLISNAAKFSEEDSPITITANSNNEINTVTVSDKG